MAPLGRSPATRLDLVRRLDTSPGFIRYHVIVPLIRHPGLALMTLSLLGGGCIPRDRTGFDAVGPSHRLDAIVLAADQSDDASLRGLVQQLDSDDPAARLLAIRALEKRTGQTLDYCHDDPPWKRNQGVARWTQWLDAREGAPAAPVGQSPDTPEAG